MLKTLLAIAAKRVILDRMSNEISIIDVFDGFKSQSFPIITNTMLFFSLRRDESDEATKSVSLRCSVDDMEFFNVNINIDFRQGKTTRSIVSLNGFTIPKAGNLRVVLLDGEDIVGSLELPVEQLDIPSPEIQSDPSHPTTA